MLGGEADEHVDGWARMKDASPTLAIVIPVGPGDLAWRDLLPQLVAPQAREIALVFAQDDAGSRELSLDGVTAIIAPRGRAQQMNAGAAATESAWIWFLHADSRMAQTTLPRLLEFIGRKQPVLGYFDLRFRDDGPWQMRLNAVGVWLRSRVLGLPFGDQGLLMPRSVFDALGGFDPALHSGEDHALVWEARRAGVALRAVGAPLLTSARKYARDGWWRTTTHHLRLTWRQARLFSQSERAQ